MDEHFALEFTLSVYQNIIAVYHASDMCAGKAMMQDVSNMLTFTPVPSSSR